MSELPDQQRGLRRNRKSHVARIVDFWMDKRGVVTLTPEEEMTWERLKMAMSLRTNKGYNSQQAARAIVKEHGVSATQAARDVQNSIVLYGDISKAEKEGHRHVASEMALKAYRMAIQADDAKGANAATVTYMKIHGVDKEDSQEFDYSKLQQHLFAKVLDERSRAVMDKVVEQKGVIDLMKLYAEDVKAAEVPNEPADE